LGLIFDTSPHLRNPLLEMGRGGAGGGRGEGGAQALSVLGNPRGGGTRKTTFGICGSGLRKKGGWLLFFRGRGDQKQLQKVHKVPPSGVGEQRGGPHPPGYPGRDGENPGRLFSNFPRPPHFSHRGFFGGSGAMGFLFKGWGKNGGGWEGGAQRKRAGALGFSGGRGPM